MSNPTPLPRGIAHWLALAAEPERLLTELARVHAAARSGADDGVWIHVCDATAWDRQLSRLADRLAASDGRAPRARHPLLGVPFAVKDNIHIEGVVTTAACPAFARVATTSATVVRRLLDAGAIWVGKTNLDQFATGLVGTRSPYGRPASVADAARISGGSSSGSAVAVARGIVPFALGTDTAGSGRVPAAFNGLVGLKPTPGRVGTAGVVPACRTLDCVSVFGHSVADAVNVLSVIEGPDEDDPYSAFRPGPAAYASPTVRLGVPARPVFHGDDGYAAAWQAALVQAQRAGHTLVEIDFDPLHEVAALLYEGPWVAERHAACRGVFDVHPERLDPTVRRVVQGAIGRSATEVFEAAYRLQALKARLASTWDRIDALLVPTAPLHPTFAQVDADPVGTNSLLGTYTNFVNLLGWCALAVPAGTTSRGLPFGVTFIAAAGYDAALARLGAAWCGEPASPLLAPPQARAELPLAVVGAHLSGLPLNHQLRERGARLLASTTTAPHYRLFALAGTTPPKPGLLRVAEGGAAIAVEVWSMPADRVGSFLALVPPPLGLGSVQLADGRHVHGFLCEHHALAGAEDITASGGWRAHLASRASSALHDSTAPERTPG
jgi:allophanate hydrolase